jgi:hypothetical protein
MRDCCPANQFDGGCEDGHCRSYLSRAKTVTKAERTVVAKELAFQASMRALALVGLAALFLIAILFAAPESKKIALRNQENIHVSSR